MNNLSRVYSAEIEGIDAQLIEVETDINVGLHSFTIVGLADKALSEAKERVNSALKNIGVKAPNRENRKIVVNLAPADVKKTGSQYDLAIAVGYLLATKQIKEFNSEQCLFVGELSLNGTLRPVNGALNIARLVRENNSQFLFLPEQNASEAAMVPDIEVIPVKNLTTLIDHLEEKNIISSQPVTQARHIYPSGIPSLMEVKGQAQAKRAFTIAAAGGHNLLMVGPPGTGKSLLAQALSSILPELSLREILEVTQVYSAAGALEGRPYVAHRPFRSPHQTASPASIIGGGQTPRPGEISLAHRGVLFLDELPEFRRDILESLRQPIESGKAIVSRAKKSLTFPARFMLIAAMNPCPCGYYGDEERACSCTAHEVFRYQKKVSGPLLDRIDIQITVPRIKIEELRKESGHSDELDAIREQIKTARSTQAQRFQNGKRKIQTNTEMTSKECDALVGLSPEADEFVKSIFDQSLISPRGYYRILKTARTIADLEASKQVNKSHLAEAFSYRVRAAAR
jgi:magnesium chelatase family protein